MKRKVIAIVGWVLLLGVGIAAGALTVKFMNDSGKDKTSSNGAPEQLSQEPALVSANSRWLFTGNVFWGRYINDWSMASDLQFAYPFSRLSEFNRQDYNAWIGGLECPLKSGIDISSYAQEETLSFNCRPEYLPEAAKYYTAFTLANNHTDNQGTEAFAETEQNLQGAGIQYFGHYDPNALDSLCNVVKLTTLLHYDNGSTKEAALPIVFCGYHGVFQVVPDESLRVIEKYANKLPVIAMPHTGAEYVATPDSIKTATYRKMIDYGADMVIGDHPHWVQTSEAYNGKLIAYSLGNFMFDQQYNTEVARSALIDVTATVSTNMQPEVIEKYTEIASSCMNNINRCMELIAENNLPELELTYQFDILGSNDGDKIVKPATPDELEQIKQRLNWTATSAGLTQTSSAQ